MADSTDAMSVYLGRAFGHGNSNMTSQYLKSLPGAGEVAVEGRRNAGPYVVGLPSDATSAQDSAGAWGMIARHLGHKSKMTLGYCEPSDGVPL